MLFSGSLFVQVGSPERRGTLPQAWLMWCQRQGLGPGLVTPFQLSNTCCHGSGLWSGRILEKSRHGQLHSRRTCFSGCMAEVRVRAPGRGSAEFQGRVGWLEAPGRPSTWEDPLETGLMGWKGQSWELSGLSVLSTEERSSAGLPVLHARCCAESLPCTGSFNLLPACLCYMPSAVLSHFHVLVHLISARPLWGRVSWQLYTSGETEA